MTDTDIEKEAYDRLLNNGVRPSAQRMAIMQYLLGHATHPTIDEVYKAVNQVIPSLSRTTVYNTLRLFADHHAAQMITIDDHRVCYDGDIRPHVHFFCKCCGRVIDLFGERAPHLLRPKNVEGNLVEEEQLYYKGVCAECRRKSRSGEA